MGGILSVIRRIMLSGDLIDTQNASLRVADGYTFGVHRQVFLLNILTDTGLVLFQSLEAQLPLSSLEAPILLPLRTGVFPKSLTASFPYLPLPLAENCADLL